MFFQISLVLKIIFFFLLNFLIFLYILFYLHSNIHLLLIPHNYLFHMVIFSYSHFHFIFYFLYFTIWAFKYQEFLLIVITVHITLFQSMLQPKRTVPFG